VVELKAQLAAGTVTVPKGAPVYLSVATKVTDVKFSPLLKPAGTLIPTL
jgi:hypothetical protein